MLRAMCAFVTSLLAVGFAPLEAWAASEPTTGWADIAAHTLPATVNIEISKVALGGTDTDTEAQTTSGQTAPEQSREFFGSGFITDPSGIIVTNKHVINGA